MTRFPYTFTLAPALLSADSYTITYSTTSQVTDNYIIAYMCVNSFQDSLPKLPVSRV